LLGLAFVWTIFAIAQDFKKREVPNWLNFSLIGFALAYRAFYALHVKDSGFFLFGLMGFGVFFVLAYGFYYARAFAGGDAKLLMGFGIILPYNSFSEFVYISFVFIFFLFSLGSIYSLIYSVSIVTKRKEKFFSEFKKQFVKFYLLFVIIFVFFVGISLFSNFLYGFLFLVSFSFIGLLSLYLKSLDKCLIVKTKPSKLSEGDWLEYDVRAGGRKIGKSVHGLSRADIKWLTKFGKEVYVKEGIPFTPAFLLSLFMVFAFSVLGYQNFFLF